MDKIKINENTLVIGNKVVPFDKKILEVKVFNGRIIVLLELDGSLDNVYCVDSGGGLLWRIKEPDKGIIGNNRYPYVGISLTEKCMAVVDFYGRKLYVDINSGKIIDKEIVK
ncbi:hypothetical protein ACFQWC_13750 [Rossellomorea sp. GCM10028870]|uniref:hypothetical protein n=1 Tax=Rossellomorea sp. GCM10028870 TaxID=3273426 RepID=UPI00361860B6